MGDAAWCAMTLESARQATPCAAHVECAAFGMGAQILKLAHKSEYSFQGLRILFYLD